MPIIFPSMCFFLKEFPSTDSLFALVSLQYDKMGSHDGETDELPPPPPVPPNIIPIKADDFVGELPPNNPAKPKRLPMARPSIGRKGQQIQLYLNHYKVTMKSTEDFFFYYHVCMLSSSYNLVFMLFSDPSLYIFLADLNR
jgi:hypothetical protein